MHRIAGGGKEWYLIRRLKCSSDKCGKLHNELPDCLCPYKHCDAGLIEDVVDGVISEGDIQTSWSGYRTGDVICFLPASLAGSGQALIYFNGIKGSATKERFGIDERMLFKEVFHDRDECL